MLVISDAAIRKHLLKNISVDKVLLRLRECNMKLLKLEYPVQASVPCWNLFASLEAWLPF